MIVLGLGFTDHETSAALSIDGELVNAIARERLTRVKRDGKTWGTRRLDLTPAIQYCLEPHGLTVKDVDLVVWSDVDHSPAAAVYGRLAEEGALDISAIPHTSLSHHFAHAVCAYYMSPFEEAAVFIADGGGGLLDASLEHCSGPETEAMARGLTLIQNLAHEGPEPRREQESFYRFDGRQWKTLRKIVGHYVGLGAEYGTASEVLFGDCLDAGKTMGLAPYGRPYDRPVFLEPLEGAEAPAFRSKRSPQKDALKQEIAAWRRSRPSPPDYEEALPADFAASIQAETEEALLVYARWLQGRTGLKKLCLSGGVALNCVANSRIAEETGFEEVFVPPAPSDDGIAVGCALYGASVNGGVKRISHPAFLGRPYPHDPSALSALGLRPVAHEQDVYDTVAAKIADGAVVAWYQEGAELGPRALGHRSFLADPRRDDMRDYINKHIKNREPFRPFAPVVLAEASADVFVESFPSHFMSFIARVREEKLALIPAVAHVDATARYQVLREQDNPQLYKLVSAFARLTGIPILLNTSFNRAGEALVETPLDAARCALASSADYLVIDNHLYRCPAARASL